MTKLEFPIVVGEFPAVIVEFPIVGVGEFLNGPPARLVDTLTRSREVLIVRTYTLTQNFQRVVPDKRPFGSTSKGSIVSDDPLEVLPKGLLSVPTLWKYFQTVYCQVRPFGNPKSKVRPFGET